MNFAVTLVSRSLSLGGFASICCTPAVTLFPCLCRVSGVWRGAFQNWYCLRQPSYFWTASMRCRDTTSQAFCSFSQCNDTHVRVLLEPPTKLWFPVTIFNLWYDSSNTYPVSRCVILWHSAKPTREYVKFFLEEIGWKKATFDDVGLVLWHLSHESFALSFEPAQYNVSKFEYLFQRKGNLSKFFWSLVFTPETLLWFLPAFKAQISTQNKHHNNGPKVTDLDETQPWLLNKKCRIHEAPTNQD